ncbi:MAG: hypothetical protein JO110_26310, partial [Acetobacteraceae bacterium]|nr:hypothetical protein [Acetobacteraceae bacterium]
YDPDTPQLFVISSADGVNFTTPALVDSAISTGNSPAMTVFNNRLYICAQSIYFMNQLNVTSSPDGINFFNSRAYAIHIGSAPAMTALGNRLYVSFQANDPGHALFVTSSTDGVNFTTPATGYPGILIGSPPASGEFGDRLWVAFQANDPSHVLFVAASSAVADAQ